MNFDITPKNFDIADLLYPINDDYPAGRLIRYTSDYEGLRREIFDHEDDSQTNWHKVEMTAKRLLREESKDLQLSFWLCLAVTTKYGLTGLKISFAFIAEFYNKFHFSCFPKLGNERRIALFEWFDKRIAVEINKLPVTNEISKQKYVISDWLHVQYVQNIGARYADQQAYVNAEIANPLYYPDAIKKAVQDTDISYYDNGYSLLCGTEETIHSLQDSLRNYGEKFTFINVLQAIVQAKTIFAKCREIKSQVESSLVRHAVTKDVARQYAQNNYNTADNNGNKGKKGKKADNSKKGNKFENKADNSNTANKADNNANNSNTANKAGNDITAMAIATIAENVAETTAVDNKDRQLVKSMNAMRQLV